MCGRSVGVNAGANVDVVGVLINYMVASRFVGDLAPPRGLW
jgi:hypothetical protein